MRTDPFRPDRAALAGAALVALCACRGSRDTVHLEAKGALGPYSAAVAAGDLVFLAGKGGDASLSFRDEVNGAIDAIESDLAGLGLTLADVVSVNVFLADMASFAELNEVYAARFPKPYPARTTVAAAALPKNLRVELQAIARRR
jgi:2-iminobutanoate/2-iminopropanoate deaminase